MKRKPKEKLSDGLEKLFLTHVREYDYFYFPQYGMPKVKPPIEEWTPSDFAKYISKRCMDMIDEYEPEDIE